MVVSKSLKNVLSAVVVAASASAMSVAAIMPAQAEAKKEFKLAWTIYVGWMPWQWANETGLVKKWADKYGIKIDVVQVNDYANIRPVASTH